MCARVQQSVVHIAYLGTHDSLKTSDPKYNDPHVHTRNLCNRGENIPKRPHASIIHSASRHNSRPPHYHWSADASVIHGPLVSS